MFRVYLAAKFAYGFSIRLKEQGSQVEAGRHTSLLLRKFSSNTRKPDLKTK